MEPEELLAKWRAVMNLAELKEMLQALEKISRGVDEAIHEKQNCRVLKLPALSRHVKT